jgi:ethanolamine ammonia-lyase large subunit
MMRGADCSSSRASLHAQLRVGARKHADDDDFSVCEYLYDARQIATGVLEDRVVAHLEDHFCEKLLGIHLRSDACYTDRADGDRNEREPLGLRSAQEYEAWLEETRIMRERTAYAGNPSSGL